MKIFLIILVFTTSCFMLTAQEALTNFGNFKMHPTAQVGFHIDVINDGISDNNEGAAGFYNQSNPLNLSGNNQMNFEDLSIDVVDDLNLFTSLGVTDNVTFVNGRINTPRTDQTILFKFLNDNPYIGSNNSNHIDGYAQFEGSFGFTFPLGDDFETKPLRIEDYETSHKYIASYFKEDPNTTTSFPSTFNTSNFEPTLDIISGTEFWYLDSIKDVNITLSWTASSNINATASNLNDLRIVGWDEIQQLWVDLGNDITTGDLTAGSIRSRVVSSERYKIYTIGSILKTGNSIFVYNALTPDGDGLNDTLIIRGIESIPGNQLFIYNRWGVLLYQKDNYDNSFNGISDGRSTYNKEKELSSGTYYYVLKIPQQSDLAGYFYINR